MKNYNNAATQSDIIKAQNALYNVFDPELLINIMDLGLVYDIRFSDNTIFVTMTLTTSHCPMGEAITNGVQNALEAAFTNHEIDIHITFDPPWDYEMLTPEGRAQLEK